MAEECEACQTFQYVSMCRADAKNKRLQHLSFAYGLPLHYSVRLLAA